MTDVPEPLTPTGCDLRDYTWMPLDVRRLLTSETWILGSAEVKVACMTLWCEAWQQVPAASLPDNDRIIAHLSASGPVWKKIRDDVLRGWVKCSDGRIYHPVVAEKARESWALKLAQKARTEAARQAKQNKRIAPTEVPPAASQKDATSSVTETVAKSVTEPVALSVTETVTGSTRQEQTRTDLKEERELPAVVPHAPKIALPDWLPTEAWNGYLDMRRKAKKVPTDRAVSMLIAKLDEWRRRGIDVAAALDQSTVSGWTDVYEPRGAGRQQPVANRFEAWDLIGSHLEGTA